ncbi:unnamed protein product [Psylliodes chrysocephalus]|uniref:FAD dependent oxidoreductase domain-containing protein n=1 Tax=Psylliodes chrysocephalus TaxID=3402493 RepID=A0A9P0CYM4_9CUCU|nr:unnamed protein product [Psylliodes chrysocephala]
MTDLKVAVVGSGVIGLTTAIELQKSIRNANVSILSDGFNEDTTSWVAAGIFRPGGEFKGENKEITQKWIDDSWYYWKNIQDSRYGAEAGVTELSGYTFSNRSENAVRNPYIEKLVPIYRPATETELTSLCPQKWKFGSYYSTLLIENSIYLPWATEKFKADGGTVIHQRVDSLPSLGEKYDIVVNCAGLGSQTLCNDDELVPVRGQVIKVDAPWLKMFFYADSSTYIIPGFKSVTLGGCRELGSYDLNPDKYVSLGIRERCENLVPSLKGAREIRTLVGLRPYRKSVRVEKETKICMCGKKVKIVHHYGHGGYGVTAAPGTSLHAVRLVKEMWAGNSKL